VVHPAHDWCFLRATFIGEWHGAKQLHHDAFRPTLGSTSLLASKEHGQRCLPCLHDPPDLEPSEHSFAIDRGGVVYWGSSPSSSSVVRRSHDACRCAPPPAKSRPTKGSEEHSCPHRKSRKDANVGFREQGNKLLGLLKSRVKLGYDMD